MFRKFSLKNRELACMNKLVTTWVSIVRAICSYIEHYNSAQEKLVIIFVAVEQPIDAARRSLIQGCSPMARLHHACLLTFPCQAMVEASSSLSWEDVAVPCRASTMRPTTMMEIVCYTIEICEKKES